MAATRYTDATLCWRLLLHARPHWSHLIASFLMGLLVTPLTLLGPLPLKIALDSVIGSHPLPGFLLAVLPASVAGSGTALLVLSTALLVFNTLLGRLHALASDLWTTRTGEKLVLDFRAQLFQNIQRLSLSYHDSRGSPDAIYRVQCDA